MPPVLDDLLQLACGSIVTGFEGVSLDAAARRALHRARFGGYILFGRNLTNAAQARALTDELRSLHDGDAPLIAVDQEGGRIARLVEGVEPLPAAMALGALDDARVTMQAGEQLGHDLRRCGFNVDLAPVLDLAIDPRNVVIGTRSFGAAPDAVARLGGSFARGLERRGVAATMKHFPGHGATAFDTHLGPARLDSDEATLFARDLAPFRMCLEQSRVLMAAHVAVPALDGDVPASLSTRMLTGILRGRWGYDGVCITDCLQMDAIARGVGTVAGAVRAVAAGADIVLISHDPELAFEAARSLARSVVAGEVAYARLTQAAARVSRLRAGLCEPLAFDAPSPHAGIGRALARDAVTLVRGAYATRRERCVAVTFGDTVPAALGVEAVDCVLDPDTPQAEALIECVLALGKRPIVLARRAHLHAGQGLAIDALLAAAPECIVVSTAEPYDVPRLHTARTLLASYGDDALALGGVAAVLFDGAMPRGRLPVAL